MVDKAVGCVGLRGSTEDDQDHGAIAGERSNSRMEPSGRRWCRVKPFSSVCAIVHVIRGSYGTRVMSKILLWRNYLLFIDSFNKRSFVILRSTQSKVFQHSVDVVNKDLCF